MIRSTNPLRINLVGGFNNLETYEFVNGKDYPTYEMENQSHVWNHQPVTHSSPSTLAFSVASSTPKAQRTQKKRGLCEHTRTAANRSLVGPPRSSARTGLLVFTKPILTAGLAHAKVCEMMLGPGYRLPETRGTLIMSKHVPQINM